MFCSLCIHKVEFLTKINTVDNSSWFGTQTIFVFEYTPWKGSSCIRNEMKTAAIINNQIFFILVCSAGSQVSTSGFGESAGNPQCLNPQDIEAGSNVERWEPHWFTVFEVWRLKTLYDVERFDLPKAKVIS